MHSINTAPTAYTSSGGPYVAPAAISSGPRCSVVHSFIPATILPFTTYLNSCYWAE